MTSEQFNWLRSAMNLDSFTGVPGAAEATEFYADYNGDGRESLEALLKLETPYVVDLRLRYLTAILEGTIKDGSAT